MDAADGTLSGLDSVRTEDSHIENCAVRAFPRAVAGCSDLSFAGEDDFGLLT